MRSAIVRAEYRRVAILLLAGLLLSLWFDSLWPALILLLVYLLFHVFQLSRLGRWIERFRPGEAPPESSGLWGRLFDELYHLLRRESSTREALETLIDRAESSVTALRDAIVVVDRDGRIEYWNRAAERLLGLRSPGDRRQTFTNLVRDTRLREYLEVMDFGEPLTVPAPMDETRMLEFTVTRFGGGDWLILVRDVTRLHNLEQMRKDFVANVSHELKTPLTVIKGYLETLMDQGEDQSPGVRRALGQMEAQSQRMEALVNDLLLLARLEASEPANRPGWVELAPQLEELRSEALLLEPEKNHVVVIDVPQTARVRGDPVELRSAFGNLMTNAVKYTPAGGTIQVSWSEDDAGGHLAVVDNGIGIDPKHIPRLTERFYRPDTSRVTRTGGTGLGLAIVKHVMLRHDGHLAIESRPERGSTFTCHFPPERLRETESVRNGN